MSAPRAVTAHARTPRTSAHAGSALILTSIDGWTLAPQPGVIWFYEKQDALLVCEIRKADDETTYEFEIADSQGPKTQRFASPKELIAAYLNEESRLRADGWLPSAGNIDSLR